MSNQTPHGSLTVRGEAAKLTIDVLGYENAHAQTVSDANWLKTSIRFDSDVCTCRFQVAITTQDLQRLCRELEHAMSKSDGSAVLTTDEEAIDLHLVLRKTGAVRITGQLKDVGTATVAVAFDFSSDQSFITEMVSELKALQQRFPVIEQI